MTRIYLQPMLEQLPESKLPPAWNSFDLAAFSKSKSLWDYQQAALQNALKALWKYYNEVELSEAERKAAYYRWYEDAGLEEDLDIPLDDSTAPRRAISRLLKDYYIWEERPQARGKQPVEVIPFVNLINRMAFWMATGSGKTLVLVKLVEILHQLIRMGEIPARDILILTYRDDLLDQLNKHVQEFNTSGSLEIQMHELRDYNEIKHNSPTLFSASECHIFYYRSDNLSDEQKEKIIDFRSYENDGQWYLLLDEAHKGDREDSKRQQIYSIMSRAGFLFNFSATFTDDRDIVTTAYNFNLSEFIRRGYGKHIYVFEQETKAFRKNEDFTESDKQKIVLKALVMLCLARRQEAIVRQVDARLYHRPLLMTLVNSVNTEEADLKLFFREIVRIGKGEINANQWQAAILELRSELGKRPLYLYETDAQVHVSEAALEDLTPQDLLETVFNANVPGDIEVLVRPSKQQEIAFKLKTSENPFALIRIGDVSEWLTRELSGYEISHRFTDESFFERLNKDDSEINILMGSRSFYEGWDSNRPNVIMYINIGVGVDAKKFILQSVGRGARIQPLPGKRRRFWNLHLAEELSADEEALYQQVKSQLMLLESEFIFGTNQNALATVISELDQEDQLKGSQEISLELNQAAVEGKLLLVPVYKGRDKTIRESQTQAKFALSAENVVLFQDYLEYIQDDRVLMALYDAGPKEIRLIREGIAQDANSFRTDGPRYKNVDVMFQQFLRFISLYGKDFERFKELEEEINHFKHIRVFLPEVEFEVFEQHLSNFREKPKKIAELKEKYIAGQLSFEDILNQTQGLEGAEKYRFQGQEIQFKNFLNHYYLPLIVSEDEKIEYIRSIIKVDSEVKFLEKLEQYLATPVNKFQSFDWWIFSRIDENYDQVNIPYYNPFENKIQNFKPDFIFWLQKGNTYHILFVDPKGTSRTEYEHKVDGFRELFEENDQPKHFSYNEMTIQLHLALFTADRAFAADYYRRYWFDTIDSLFKDFQA
ncbi:MAG TPA: DEAD/DEAH box helicase family protein [Anaerolineaceae bacterium]|nr:DEAD/DEAH box helicase family protein [Anaerolineaceae bacterium]HUM49206.1 DEAD/DEAH box helicase family protein [Anaerolineaceae bacterium]